MIKEHALTFQKRNASGGQESRPGREEGATISGGCRKMFTFRESNPCPTHANGKNEHLANTPCRLYLTLLGVLSEWHYIRENLPL